MTGPGDSRHKHCGQTQNCPSTSGSFDDPTVLRRYNLSSAMGLTSHSTIIIPTSRSENPITYPAASQLCTLGPHGGTVINHITNKPSPRPALASASMLNDQQPRLHWTLWPRIITPITSGSCNEAALLREYNLSSEMSLTSHNTIIIPTSRSENPLTYPAASHLCTLSPHGGTVINHITNKSSPRHNLASASMLND
ncbi:hypothetical protein AVEN_238219-1 [Araneus ventricosus]|uniref:Uncharacterized protein n=1 Tax=Araneus ventricosus TaxID=182803 RepID=A0A4Y2I5E7_ARAVE|nr:hypothetical protein AVEN_238219-1 [Araneus ventricosus]